MFLITATETDCMVMHKHRSNTKYHKLKKKRTIFERERFDRGCFATYISISDRSNYK